jgi:two-component system response regulator PilR (NtrC family)
VDGGTLFLDEVADLPFAMQVKMLRAIQEKRVRPVGAEREVAVDVRILSASHKDLDAMVKLGQFRQDLYYRLNVINLHVPALRERAEDIELLAEHILDRLAAQDGVERSVLSPQAVEALTRYAFPGNVRELENILERAMTLCDGNIIHRDDLAIQEDHQAGQQGNGQSNEQSNEQGGEQDGEQSGEVGHDALDAVLESVEKEAILNALEQSRWNKTAAAKALGISFGALRYRMQKLGLD